MELRKDEKQQEKAPEVRREEPKPKLQIVKLEERVAPIIVINHNDTLVRDQAEAKEKAPEVVREEPKPKLQIVKLEERIAPFIGLNHNETLVRDRSACAR